jgi:hypothetical protein
MPFSMVRLLLPCGRQKEDMTWFFHTKGSGSLQHISDSKATADYGRDGKFDASLSFFCFVGASPSLQMRFYGLTPFVSCL